MQPNYYEIYSEIRVAYRERFEGDTYPFRRSRQDEESQLDFLDKVIFEAEERNHKRLRPDARVFLLTNFHLMVQLPLTHPLATVAPREVKEAIIQDIHSIIGSAADSSKGEPEISGGAILRTTANLWQQLKINARNIWT